MGYQVIATGTGVPPGHSGFNAEDAGAALTLLANTRRKFPKAAVRVVRADNGREVGEVELKRLRDERDAADRAHLRGNNA